MRMIYLVSLLVLSLVICAVSPCYGATNLSKQQLYIRENGTDILVEIYPPSGTLVLYQNGEDCGVGSHKTAEGARRFKHVHVSYTLPQDGYDGGGESHEVTATKIDAYWDNYYAAKGTYATEGSVDVASNCLGYALGFSTWIEDPSYIYSDDYNVTTTYEAGIKSGNSDHIINIDEVWPDNCNVSGKAKTTREKNGASHIYKRSYASPGGTFANLKKHK